MATTAVTDRLMKWAMGRNALQATAGMELGNANAEQLCRLLINDLECRRSQSAKNATCGKRPRTRSAESYE